MELYPLLYLHSNPNSHSVRIISLLKVEGKLSQLEDVQLTPWNEILMSFILHVSTTILTVLLYRMRATRNPTSTPCCACPIKSKDSTVICTHNYHRIETRCWIQFFFFHLFFSSTFFVWKTMTAVDVCMWSIFSLTFVKVHMNSYCPI